MTLLEKYNAYVSGQGVNVVKDEAIVFDILTDLTDRSGLRQVFDDIDDPIKEQILNSWLTIIENHS